MNQKKVWNKIAPQWNIYRTKTTEPVIKFISNQKGKILDVGCGSGRNFIENKQIYGVDFSKEMLNFAKEKKTAKELKLMKRCKIPYKNNFFNAAICIAVLHCIKSKKKRQKLLKEIYRILKPGSKALITSWGKNNPKLKDKGKFTKVSWKIDQKKWLRNTYIYDKKELENELKDIGFKILKSSEDRNVRVIVRKNQ